MQIDTRTIGGVYLLTRHPDGSVTAQRIKDGAVLNVRRDTFRTSTADLLPFLEKVFAKWT